MLRDVELQEAASELTFKWVTFRHAIGCHIYWFFASFTDSNRLLLVSHA